MIKHYVGARYVPKFASPVEWAANTSYEALTIVTFNNASYTSKVPVPPTVGNPANNPQYWALTGNYNALVEQYRQETETANNILQGNINLEAIKRASADSNLQSQINQIVAPSGEAPSAAEVQNARIGADGVTYDTLGNAIRGQVNDLKSAIDNITENTKNLLSVNKQDYKTVTAADGNAYISNITKDSITVSVAIAGTYRYVYLPVDVTGITNLTASAESTSGSGEGYLRIGTVSGGAITWLASGTATFVTANVSGKSNVVVALYAATATSAAVGTALTYNKLQIESGTIRTGYEYPKSAIDIVARKSIQNIMNKEGYLCNQYAPTLVDGYVNYHTGAFSSYSGSGAYKRTGLIVLPKGTYVIDMPYSFSGDAGYAFYDEDQNFISGAIKKYDRFIIDGFYSEIPNNAAYVAFSSYVSTGVHPTRPIRFYQHRPELTTIACLGDSITEGMNMNSQRYVEYGGDNYPSHLQTLLYDHDYDAFVNNYGNSGEKTDAVLARLGGSGAIYFGSTITIPADNSVVDVTNKVYSSYTHEVVTFTKIDYRALAFVNGQMIRLQMNSGKLYVNLWESAGKTVQILGNAPIILGKYFYDRTADIAICYMGINDTNTITFAEWIKRNNIVRQMFGENRTLIIGTTNAQWNIYPDTKDLPNPVVTYNQGCAEAFGDYFVNLFPIMCQQRGIDIALEGGYLADRTSEQIAADNTAIAAWQVPPSLTVDGTQGNVHFNNVGYYVMAKIIYDRMIDLNLI